MHARTRTPATPWDDALIGTLIDELSALRAQLARLPAHEARHLERVHREHGAGAANLVHYVGLRRRDLRRLQTQLAQLGLSSLGRAESHVLANVDKVLGILHRLAGRDWTALSRDEPAGINASAHLLRRHAERLLGPPRPHRTVRIMVTLPPAAAHDYALVRDMLAAGMDCARINCAHDDAGAWAAMIERLDRARRELGRPCKVLMDLGGPKLRTGEVEPGPQVLKWRPQRDAFGRVRAPARIFLRAHGERAGGTGADRCVDVDGTWLARLRSGDRVEFTDARGKKRELAIGAAGEGGRWAQSAQTAYLVPQTELLHRPSAKRTRADAGAATRPLALPAPPQRLLLRKGDTLLLTASGTGRPARLGTDGRVEQPATIPCTLPQVFADLRPSERIWLDDGRIGGVIREVSPAEVKIEITAARARGERLGPDKGINLPDSQLRLGALTAKDRADLAFVARHADLVGLSFVQRPADVAALQRRLRTLGAERLGILLKIETRRAFENLPALLLAGMASASVGVMIARGDLAVELGYERLAEVQEEILWLAESGHLPVVWATQVLESLATGGVPSRAEITDAAMGVRAECVMLNKGEFIVAAIETLDDILTRMEAHQNKKRSMLRKLHW
ncbi:MAG: pyruvate kinase [Gammaproteobacteria bacterium]